MRPDRKMFIFETMMHFLRLGQDLNSVLMTTNITENEVISILNEMEDLYRKEVLK